MKVKYSQIVSGLLYLAMLLDLGFLYVVNLPPIIKQYRFVWISLIGVVTALIVLSKFGDLVGEHLKFINKYTMLLLISLFIISVYSYFKYPIQSIIDMVLSMQYYLVYFLVYAFIFMFSKKGIEGFMLSIHRIVILWEILLILNSAYYTATGNQILYYFSDDNVSVRVGIRIALYVLAHVLLIYDFEKIINNQKGLISNKLAVVNLILGTYCLLIVEQTRGHFLAIFAAWFAILILNSKKKSTVMLRVILLVTAYILLVKSGYLQSIFSSLTGASEIYGDYGQQARISSMNYFWNCFLSNPLCGIGFVRYGGAYNTIVRGASGSFFANDVGIFGIIGNIGIFAFIIYGVLLMRYAYDLIVMFKYKSRFRFFSCGLLTYIIFTTPSLIMFWSTTCLLFPLSMAVFEYGIKDGLENRERL